MTKIHFGARSSLYCNTLALAMLIAMVGLSTAQTCTLTGCVTGACYILNSDMKCSNCKAGYYKSTTLEICNACNSRCKSCTYFDNCQSCNDGYYLDTSQNFCGSCPTKCETCTSVDTCTSCTAGANLNYQNKCDDSSGQSTGTTSSSKSSVVGQIIGYCVSGIVLILCCIITLLHQKRKQEEEEKARKQFREEQARLQDGGALAAPNRGNIDVVEDPEFNDIHNRPSEPEAIFMGNSKTSLKAPQDLTTSASRLTIEGQRKCLLMGAPLAASPLVQSVSSPFNNTATVKNSEVPVVHNGGTLKLIRKDKIQHDGTKDLVKAVAIKEVKDHPSPRVKVDMSQPGPIPANQTQGSAVASVFARSKKAH